jgi:hypothetical protein
MSDINTTPLVDVMLVLLIIFLIAVPVVMQNGEARSCRTFVRSDHHQARECFALGDAAEADGGSAKSIGA